jgi:hypothetical protein
MPLNKEILMFFLYNANSLNYNYLIKICSSEGL